MGRRTHVKVIEDFGDLETTLSEFLVELENNYVDAQIEQTDVISHQSFCLYVIYWSCIEEK